MSYVSIINAIRSRVKTLIQDGESVSVFYDNQSPPDNFPEDVWARCSVLTGERIRVSVGGTSQSRYRIPGVLILSLFARSGKGDKAIRELADVCVASFTSTTADGVTYRTASVTVQGKTGTDWQLNVSCPFYSDEFA